MSELSPDIAPQVVEACKANADEAAGALARALGGTFTLAVGEAVPFDASAAPEGFDGAALVLLLRFGDAGFGVVLPTSSGLVPEWCAAPDATGESKLATLAQELSMLLAPETLEASEFKARQIVNASSALAAAKVAAGAALVPISLTSAEKSGQLSLIWPLEAPGELLPTAAAAASEPPAPPKKPAPVSAPKAAAQLSPSGDLNTLPNYSRSLLKISVPVSVQLAAKKELVQEVIGLAPGSIIKFEKGCEELLQMIVGEHTVAEGEAVKIGDKFGFRVTSMVMPPEHFVSVKKPRRA